MSEQILVRFVGVVALGILGRVWPRPPTHESASRAGVCSANPVLIANFHVVGDPSAYGGGVAPPTL